MEKENQTSDVVQKVKTETSQENFAAPDNNSSTKSFPKKTRKFINKKFEKKGGRRRENAGRPRSEFEQKIISLRRVTRVVAGGRRFSFSVAMVIGNRNGSVGVGLGKASDTVLAIEKAVRDAKNNLITPRLTKTGSIPYDVEVKYCASKVMMVPAPGKGLKAGGSMRAVLELLGAKDVTAKIISRSKNHINNAKATIEALKQLGVKSPVKMSNAPDENKEGKAKTAKGNSPLGDDASGKSDTSKEVSRKEEVLSKTSSAK